MAIYRGGIPEFDPWLQMDDPNQDQQNNQLGQSLGTAGNAFQQRFMSGPTQAGPAHGAPMGHAGMGEPTIPMEHSGLPMAQGVHEGMKPPMGAGEGMKSL